MVNARLDLLSLLTVFHAFILVSPLLTVICYLDCTFSSVSVVFVLFLALTMKYFHELLSRPWPWPKRLHCYFQTFFLFACMCVCVWLLMEFLVFFFSSFLLQVLLDLFFSWWLCYFYSCMHTPVVSTVFVLSSMPRLTNSLPQILIC